MHRGLRIGLNIVLSLILVIGVGVLVYQQVQHRDSAAAQDKAARTAQFTPPTPAASTAPGETAVPKPVQLEADPVMQGLAELDLAALREVNPDVAGWLYIPGTEISHPILQGPDNDYYLRHTWEKKWNSAGSIFMDWHCSRDFGDFNTIVYGHRMNNGTMFAPLHAYEDPDFWREHPSVYVAAEAGVYRYDIFAAWEPSVSSTVYTMDFDTPEKRQAFVKLCMESSRIDTGVVPDSDDKLLTLSTCTGHGHATRWVVQGVLTQVYEPPT